jgi:hypothetical protein
LPSYLATLITYVGVVVDVDVDDDDDDDGLKHNYVGRPGRPGR